MDLLLQRIKNLDQITFQQLCFQLMSERYPSARIRYVEGAVGDEGLDLFTGDLSAGPTVWQCKAFQVVILGDSQKAQIRKSLKDAVKNVAPSVWILCLNMNLDTKAHRWFQRIQRTYAAHGLKIADPIQGTDIARELMFRKTLRDHYFPEVALAVSEIRALLGGLDRLTESGLEKRATENVDQWLQRIREKDPRFSYEVTFGGERGPAIFPPMPEQGLVAAMTDGHKVIKAFARDLEALRLDPVGLEFHVSNGGARKFLDLLRTGREQHWAAQEIRGFKTTIPLLEGVNFECGSMTLMARSIPDRAVIPLRLRFKGSSGSVTFDYLPFKRMRAGTDEIEISTSKHDALRMSLVLPANAASGGKATIVKDFVGRRVAAVAQTCRALRLLQEGCEIEMFSLQLSSLLGTLQVEPMDLHLKPGFFSFIEDLAAISARFTADLRLPSLDAFSTEDEKAFHLLRAFVLNEPVPMKDLTMTLVKSQENAEALPKLLGTAGAFRMVHESATVWLFGRKLNIGKCAIQVDRAEVKNLRQAIDRFKRARIGEGIPFSLFPSTPVQLRLLS